MNSLATLNAEHRFHARFPLDAKRKGQTAQLHVVEQYLREQNDISNAHRR